MNYEQIFTNCYENLVWGDNKNINYKGSSGDGANIEFNKDFIVFLKNFITTNNIKSIVDLGSGDFKCGREIFEKLNINYYGYDIAGNKVSGTTNINDCLIG